LFENSRKASRAAQNAFAGHMRPACLRPMTWTNADAIDDAEVWSSG